MNIRDALKEKNILVILNYMSSKDLRLLKQKIKVLKSKFWRQKLNLFLK